MPRCYYCSTNTDEVTTTVNGSRVCGSCFPTWLTMRKRAFGGTLQLRGCTGSINEDGAVAHDAECPMHGAA